MLHGNLEGIKDSVLNEIESLFDYEIEKDIFISKPLVQRLCYFTAMLNREISVYINRKGRVVDVSVGTHGTANLADLSDFDIRRGENRLSGIRCVHTHPNGNGWLSDVDLSAMVKLRLDSIAAIGVQDGEATNMYCAVSVVENGYLREGYSILGPFDYSRIEAQAVLDAIADIDRLLKTTETVENVDQEERAILVGVQKSGSEHDLNRTSTKSLEELELLAETAGAQTVQKILQPRKTIDSAFYIGRGKAEEISLLRQSLNANLIIFDDELSGAQLRNLEQIIGAKVIDRTTLILDIFAARAKSKEGKIQVELAQLRYRLPRLIGLGGQLSRLGGGIGSRGPGEKKLEMDRRHIHRRVSYLENELEEIKKQRELQRSQRTKNKIPVVALVGYTNAGKSTLMNALSDAGVLAENKLFATLDPTVRKITLLNGQDVLLIDTVGFIRKLPHHLVEAFKSTLEETLYADVLVHVIDTSSNEYETQRKVVLQILKGLGADGKPLVTAYNKIDLVEEEIAMDPLENPVKISAKQNIGLEELLESIKNVLPEKLKEVEWLIPYSDGHILSVLYQNGKVLSEEYIDTGIMIKAFVNQEIYNKFNKYSH